jgi:hypothetical protein
MTSKRKFNLTIDGDTEQAHHARRLSEFCDKRFRGSVTEMARHIHVPTNDLRHFFDGYVLADHQFGRIVKNVVKYNPQLSPAWVHTGTPPMYKQAGQTHSEDPVVLPLKNPEIAAKAEPPKAEPPRPAEPPKATPAPSPRMSDLDLFSQLITQLRDQLNELHVLEGRVGAVEDIVTRPREEESAVATLKEKIQNLNDRLHADHKAVEGLTARLAELADKVAELDQRVQNAFTAIHGIEARDLALRVDRLERAAQAAPPSPRRPSEADLADDRLMSVAAYVRHAGDRPEAYRGQTLRSLSRNILGPACEVLGVEVEEASDGEKLYTVAMLRALADVLASGEDRHAIRIARVVQACQGGAR